MVELDQIWFFYAKINVAALISTSVLGILTLVASAEQPSARIGPEASVMFQRFDTNIMSKSVGSCCLGGRVVASLVCALGTETSWCWKVSTPINREVSSSAVVLCGL